MYKIVNILSILIRQIYLPNPYQIYFQARIYADIFNTIVGEGILHIFSFFLTASVYEKSRYPSWIGSTLYCINYFFNTYLIQYLCSNFSYLEIQKIIAIAFVVDVIFYIIFRGLKNLYDNVFV